MKTEKTYEEIKEILSTRLKKALKAHETPPADQFIEDLIQGIFFWGPLNGLKISRWLLDLIEVLQDFKHAPHDRFYTLVHGLIDPNEMSQFLGEFLNSIDKIQNLSEELEMIFGDLTQFRFGEVIATVPPAAVALRKIQSEFTEDEKVIIEFLRNGYCHPTLTRREPKLRWDSKANGWKDRNEYHVRLMKAFKNMNCIPGEFKERLSAKLVPHMEELKSLSILSKELTYRFGYFEHEVFEDWFNQSREPQKL